MEVTRDDLWLCTDCHLRTNGAGDDMDRAAEVDAALALMPGLMYAGHDESEPPDPEHVQVQPEGLSYEEREAWEDSLEGDTRLSLSDWEHRQDDSFSRSPCDCCGSHLGGARYYYVTLG